MHLHIMIQCAVCSNFRSDRRIVVNWSQCTGTCHKGHRWILSRRYFSAASWASRIYTKWPYGCLMGRPVILVTCWIHQNNNYSYWVYESLGIVCIVYKLGWEVMYEFVCVIMILMVTIWSNNPQQIQNWS